MHPSRRVWMSALVLAALIALGSAAPSSAQFSTDPLLRSPRLVGMGQLELVVNDPHNRLTMWDYAGNPTGIYEADSGSTFDLRPRGDTQSSVEDELFPFPGRLDQTAAMRDFGVGYEAWRRSPGSTTTYGFYGTFTRTRLDDLVSTDTELRTQLENPTLNGVLSGPMPYVLTKRMRYALTLYYGVATWRDKYHDAIVDPSGVWVDRNGDELGSSYFFNPNHSVTNRIGGGVTTSYDFGRPLTLSAGVDIVVDKVRQDNTGARYLTKFSENRPYQIGRISAIGRLGSLEYGADARGWHENADSDWLFTVSAGQGAPPLSGNGTLAGRKEEGSSLRTRARWNQGPLQLGASLNTDYLKVTTSIPSDPQSFNNFRNFIYYLPGADTLAIVLPDSVANGVSMAHTYEVSGGAAWTRLPHHAQIGVEYHWWRSKLGTDLGGAGPEPKGWNLRAGLEVPLTPVLTARGGYLREWTDLDRLTRANEYVTNALTLGLGLHPENTHWDFESGYVLGRQQADFGDPAAPRSSMQTMVAQLSWRF